MVASVGCWGGAAPAAAQHFSLGTFCSQTQPGLWCRALRSPVPPREPHSLFYFPDNLWVRTSPSNFGICSAELLKSSSANGPKGFSKWIYHHHCSPSSCAICASSVGPCRRMPPASCLSVFPCAGNIKASTKECVVFSQVLRTWAPFQPLICSFFVFGPVLEEQRGISPWSQWKQAVYEALWIRVLRCHPGAWNVLHNSNRAVLRMWLWGENSVTRNDKSTSVPYAIKMATYLRVIHVPSSRAGELFPKGNAPISWSPGSCTSLIWCVFTLIQPWGGFNHKRISALRFQHGSLAAPSCSLNYINLTVAYLSIVLHLDWQWGKQIQQINCARCVLAGGRSGQAEQQLNRHKHTRSFPCATASWLGWKCGAWVRTVPQEDFFKWGVRGLGSLRVTPGNCSFQKGLKKFRWQPCVFSICLFSWRSLELLLQGWEGSGPLTPFPQIISDNGNINPF